MKVSIPVGLLILLTWVGAQAQVSSLPAPQVGYVMAQGSSTILVVDTRTNDHRPQAQARRPGQARGRAVPPEPQALLRRRHGEGHDLGHDGRRPSGVPEDRHPRARQYRRISGLPHLSGEHRRRSTARSGWRTFRTARSTSIARPTSRAPIPRRSTSLQPSDGVSAPHFLMHRPGTQEVWLTNRPVNAPGYLLRFHGETHTVITTPTEKLETMSITGDEPNEFSQRAPSRS